MSSDGGGKEKKKYGKHGEWDILFFSNVGSENLHPSYNNKHRCVQMQGKINIKHTQQVQTYTRNQT